MAASTFTAEQRRQLAREGKSMPDGSFPVRDGNKQDLQDAIVSVGRTSPGKRMMVKVFLIRRAKQMGMTDLIPENWMSSK